MKRLLLIVFPLLLTLSTTLLGDQPLLFLSTQFVPVDEARKMREEVLGGYSGAVDFQPFDERNTFMVLAKPGGKQRPALLGALHGDMKSLAQQGLLAPLQNRPSDIRLIDSYLKLGRFNSGNQYYLPWIQATYIMAANRRALKYLPQGADINSLSYAQLKQWAANMHVQSGVARLGLPVGPKGLMHRFLQGYLYPSFTGGMVQTFRNSDAVLMWDYLKDLWSDINPRSLSFDSMHEPLLSEEVWVAWDHIARLLPALEERPDDFVVFPVPAGSYGRGYMVVLGGLAIPVDAPDPEASRRLIEYLLTPQVQSSTLRSVGFFPVLKELEDPELSLSVEKFQKAVARQSSAHDARSALLPVGLGDRAGEFNTVYKLAFSRIVLRGREVPSVLASQAGKLNRLLADANVACWPPDRVGDAPCTVK